MKENPHDIMVLALDLRLRRFGFAVLEGPRELLEWGVKNYRSAGKNDAAVVQKRIGSLLTLFLPSVIVVKHTPDRNGKRRHQYEPIVKAIEYSAGRQSAEIVLVRRNEVRSVFGRPGITKYEIAAHIAALFPDLTWKLPPTRKFYENEHHNASIFDAVSLGLTYFAQLRDIAGGDHQRPRVRPPS